MKNAIIVRQDNLGLVLDRLKRTLPKNSVVRCQNLYTTSFRTANELRRKRPLSKFPDGSLGSSTRQEFWHEGLDVRPGDLPITERYLGSVRGGKYNNVWDKGDLVAIHNGRHSEMHNFLRLAVGQRIKFVGNTLVYLEHEHPTRRGEKCIKVFESCR